MAITSVVRTIRAPLESVFEVVSDPHKFDDAVPAIIEVEFLSDIESGVGTRFRETRMMGSREAKAELEITEFVPNERVRLVSESGGIVWDSLFSVRSIDSGTELTLEMDSRPKNWLARIMSVLFKKMVAKAIAKDMDAVKTYCEREGVSA